MAVGRTTRKVNAAAPAAGGAVQSVNLGRRERKAADTRLRLFRCALELFAERGFPNVTVEDITEAADVGKGTFFNYFATKDHVLGVLAEIQLGKVNAALAHAQESKQAIRVVLHRLALRIVEEPGKSPSLARAVISSFLASEGVRDIIQRFMQEGRKMIAEIVAAGQGRGEIDRHLKSEKIALQFQQSLMGTILFWSLQGEPPLATCIEDSFQQFWRAIAASGKEQAS